MGAAGFARADFYAVGVYAHPVRSGGGGEFFYSESVQGFEQGRAATGGAGTVVQVSCLEAAFADTLQLVQYFCTGIDFGWTYVYGELATVRDYIMCCA